ncbi:acyltransferase family protein [Pseudomonas sp. RA_35y_Pfl2_P32]|uniref:acyltransferase family protein n=1 Tax=Pseudomonas sp. RA_35y_Pfl2_P32 TaxID=3088705 RepID=UPI0030D991E3
MTSFSEQENTATTPHLVHPKYRPDIDGLRAIAVLAVVFFHAFPAWLKGGFIGVDVFFVISGYLISTIIFNSLDKNSFNFLAFYGRRIKRIFPALITVLVSCSMFGWFVLYPDEYSQLGKHLLGGSTFISNFVLWNESGYFDTSAEIKPLLHLWSLGIEEQFYILWPLALWLAWKKHFNALLIITTISLISFFLNIANIHSDPSATFYLPQTRAWELLAGSLLAYINIYRHPLADPQGLSTGGTLRRVLLNPAAKPNEKIIRNTLSTAGTCLIGFGILFITKEHSFPGWWAILPVSGAFFIIAAGPDAWINKNILSSKLFVWFGLISFPLYLWHWPLLAFARIIQSDVPSREARVAAVLAAIALAWLTYRFLERPLRNNQSKLQTPILVVLMASIGVAGFTIFNLAGLPNRNAVKSAEQFNSQFVGPLWKFSQNNTCVDRYKFKEAESYGWWFCITNKDEKPTLLLLGNSYANHLYPGLAANKKINNHTLLSIGACPPNMGIPSDENTETNTTPCSGYRAYHQKLLINSIIEEEKTIKYAILDGLDSQPTDDAIKTIEERISYLESHGIQVIVFAPHIRIKKDLKGCFSRPLKSGPASCDITQQTREKIFNDFKPLIDEISKTHPTVKFFDQNELFCDFLGCSLVRNGMPLFRDEYGHYSEYASAQLATLFVKWAEQHAPEILEE